MNTGNHSDLCDCVLTQLVISVCKFIIPVIRGVYRIHLPIILERRSGKCIEKGRKERERWSRTCCYDRSRDVRLRE